MKTDAPGNFSCEIYIKSWELGFREGSTQLHIDHCPFCGPIVHGGTKEFPLSAADQAKKNVASRKQEARRNFLKRSVIAASIVGLSVLGFHQLRESESTIPTTMEAAIAADFATLDAAYATLGRAKIEAFVANDNPATIVRIYSWVQERQHSNMYDIICSGLLDRRSELNFNAYVVLQAIDPVDLKAYKNLIAIGSQRVQNETLKAHLTTMVRAIESS